MYRRHGKHRLRGRRPHFPGRLAGFTHHLRRPGLLVRLAATAALLMSLTLGVRTQCSQ